MSDNISVLYNDMQCGSVYALIKWLRHPYVCGEQNKMIADLVETEINVRNDQIKDLIKELADARKLASDLICENQGLKHKIDTMNKEKSNDQT